MPPSRLMSALSYEFLLAPPRELILIREEAAPLPVYN